MAYRDLEGALNEERRMLVEEIERLDAERARVYANLQRRDELVKQLRLLESRVGSVAPEPRGTLARLKPRLVFAVAVFVASGAGAGVGAIAAGWPATDAEAPRSLLLMVKYVDRVGNLIHLSGEPDTYEFYHCRSPARHK
jgi:hypothetical protein